MTHTNKSALVHGLYHVAIKTSNLEATRAFWRDIVGLKEIDRPNFGYPGAWLGCPHPGGQAIIHVYAGGPALGESRIAPVGAGAIDHVSLACSGYRDFVARFRQASLPFREFIVPGTSLWQLFVYDPSGMQLELTFEGSVEGDELPDVSPGRRYVAGVGFFDPTAYADLAVAPVNAE
jgi:catechol 2,3-dioxygenase-like lactoylglutathione lyase family enzyme